MPWTNWWPTTSGGYSVVAQSGANEDPAEIAERFMRRMIGDERWERLPASTRAERRAEGPALIGEIVDLQAHAAFDPASITVPVIVARGSNGADHHRRSVEHLFSAIGDPAMITIEDAVMGRTTAIRTNSPRSFGSWWRGPASASRPSRARTRRQRRWAARHRR